MLSRGLLSFAFCCTVVCSALAQDGGSAPEEGSLPVDSTGKRLNFDFEKGTLEDWTPSGNAFEGQPIKGDTVAPRRSDMKSGHQGSYWVGTFEKLKDKATGTLTSAPFKAEQRFASFRVAGGAWPQTRVELLTADDHKVFFKISGQENEQLRPVIVDLAAQAGRMIQIRIVDESTAGWGHINFDDFRFYEKKPAFKDVVEVKPPAELDAYKYAGLPPEEAAKAMTLPPGFKAQVFAAEPDIINPIAFTIDARGRIWVVQSMTYPIRAPEGQGKDSIFIFEDTDQDGRFDKKTVFMEHLNLVSGLEVGFGGVWVGAAPYLMFIPYKDVNGETKPAGEPQILLDGWGYQDTHETLNTFTWGPDGWLYGCQGVFTKSLVGKPGTPKSKRQNINAGIWRYHPTKHIFERFAEGTSNPWGIDFDENGQLIAEACVIPHLWHIIPGGRYQRQAGEHDNPYTFDDIKQIADHVHYLGDKPHSGNGRSDAAGGGHAHSGLMVYQGNNWPEEYCGKVFMNNIHGARINMDILEPQGSGYVGHHGKDFLLANDRASQILNMRVGPDGSVFMIDWYDLNQCHTRDPKDHDHTTGRIFKISYGEPKKVDPDLEKLSDQQLAQMQRDSNVWQVRTARRVLQERAAKGVAIDKEAVRVLREMPLQFSNSESQQINALQTLHVIAELPPSLAAAPLKMPVHPDRPFLRDWGIRLLAEENSIDDSLMSSLSVDQKIASPVARRALASALQRLDLERRWPILQSLLSHAEDANDHNLPLMYWYGLESVMDADPSRALKLAASTKIPNILNFAARRQAMKGGAKELNDVVALLAKVETDTQRADILSGLTLGLKGRRKVDAPPGWDELAARLSSGNPQIAAQVQTLSVVFGSKAALAGMTQTALDAKAPAADRLAAIDSLVAAKDPTLPATLQKLLGDPAVRGAAIRGLAGIADDKTPAALIDHYASFSPAEKKDALLALAGRPASAEALVATMDVKIPRADFTADVLRQLRNVKSDVVAKAISKYWAAVNETQKDKLTRIADLKRLVGKAELAAPNPSHGRVLFNATCAACHTLYGEGGKVGPDITGSDRRNLDYLMLNVVDPNAVIPADYQAWILDTTDDRNIIGLVRKQDEKSVTIQTATETLTLPRAEIASLRPSQSSMMPEGLLDALAPSDVRDLVSYLQSSEQVPLLADTESAKTFFNGKDLSNWDTQVEGLFSVEDGEIVGRTKEGIKKNQFLTNKMVVRDFRLTLQIKLVPDKANSGIQFRSIRLPNSNEMRGCQADAGVGWWGRLYEESGRKLLFPKPGQEFDGGKFVKTDDWNTYEVLAVGSKIRTAINGHLCTDLDDPQVAKEGLIGLQVHAGGPTEVRFKDLQLEIDPKFELKTVK